MENGPLSRTPACMHSLLSRLNRPPAETGLLLFQTLWQGFIKREGLPDVNPHQAETALMAITGVLKHSRWQAAWAWHRCHWPTGATSHERKSSKSRSELSANATTNTMYTLLMRDFGMEEDSKASTLETEREREDSRRSSKVRASAPTERCTTLVQRLTGLSRAKQIRSKGRLLGRQSKWVVRGQDEEGAVADEVAIFTILMSR